MTLKFYMTPGSCSTGIHILLEELELAFEAHVLNLPAGDHLKPEYLAINPKGTIPALVRDDGSALTDFIAIARWLGEAYPRAGLLPRTPDDEERVRDIMDYAGHVMHGQGFTRIFTTERYSHDPERHATIQAEGRAIVERGFDYLNRLMAGREHVADDFGIADASLFYIEFWADRIGIALPGHCRAHFQRLLQRRAVRQVLAEEGYASLLRG
ncbi:glutathione S-transferase family protein [Stutzerimonas tarimensis]|uniref:Glutathione S-transferase family protein n=1 Tax=Stutzerimonas tarimensis TaxID=1507735 RepID=A0ABV7T6S5_9GAMM